MPKRLTAENIRSLGVNLLLSLASVTLLVAGLEWLTRRIDPFTPFLMIPHEINCLRRSATYSLEFRPHCSGSLSQTLQSTNSLGMRGPEVRDDGSRRILALGDSCTWGWRVNQDESYPAVLQALLDQRPGGQRYQVLNGGVPGYTSHQGLVYLREKGLALEPAIVILGFGWNDATPLGDVEEQIAAERWLMPLMRVDDGLLIRSKLYRWLRYRSVGEKPQFGERVPIGKHIGNLEAMVDLATAHGARVLLLNFWRTERPRWYIAPMALGRRRKVPVVVYEGPRFDLVHPTVEGQRWLAEQIAATMEREGYLEPVSRWAGEPVGR